MSDMVEPEDDRPDEAGCGQGVEAIPRSLAGIAQEAHRKSLARLGLGAAHQTGRAALAERAAMLRREADQITTLLSSIPEYLPSGADEALWRLVTR